MSPEHQDTQSTLRRTSLFEIHQKAGAKLVPFAGWEMPLRYEGIITEHLSVRTSVGLFDVSHMGRIWVTGPDSVDFVNFITTNNVKRLQEYQAQYSAMCNELGKTLDDLLVYRMPNSLIMVVNAANRDDDLDWLREHQDGFDVDIEDRTEQTSLLALQGPKAQEVLTKLTTLPLDEIQYYRFLEGPVDGVDTVVSRTGYTGEDGFELLLPADASKSIWTKLMEAGQELGIKACGLGARDTLRLEMGYCLYGHELDKTITPLEAGLGWITKLRKKDNFIGREALREQESNGLKRQLIGIALLESGFPRQGFPIMHNEEEVSKLVSGTLSLSLGFGIGTRFVSPDLSEPGTRMGIDIRGKLVPAEVRELPFYKEGTHC